MNRQKIENILINMGIPVSVKGFGYIVDAVLIWDKEKKVKMTKYLYPQIAQLNGDTPKGVERAIRYAFEVARRTQDKKELIEHYIGFNNISNSDSIAMLHLRIKSDNEK